MITDEQKDAAMAVFNAGIMDAIARLMALRPYDLVTFSDPKKFTIAFQIITDVEG